jgi:hypothetical protein
MRHLALHADLAPLHTPNNFPKVMKPKCSHLQIHTNSALNSIATHTRPTPSKAHNRYFPPQVQVCVDSPVHNNEYTAPFTPCPTG